MLTVFAAEVAATAVAAVAAAAVTSMDTPAEVAIPTVDPAVDMEEVMVVVTVCPTLEQVFRSSSGVCQRAHVLTVP
jgi:hypothetical protein